MRHYKLFNIDSSEITKHTCFKKLEQGEFFIAHKTLFLVKGELSNHILLVQIMDYNGIREELTRVLAMNEEEDGDETNA